MIARVLKVRGTYTPEIFPHRSNIYTRKLEFKCLCYWHVLGILFSLIHLVDFLSFIPLSRVSTPLQGKFNKLWISFLFSISRSNHSQTVSIMDFLFGRIVCFFSVHPQHIEFIFGGNKCLTDGQKEIDWKL